MNITVRLETAALKTCSLPTSLVRPTSTRFPAVQLVHCRNRCHSLQEYWNPRSVRRGRTGRWISILRHNRVSTMRHFDDWQIPRRTRRKSSPFLQTFASLERSTAQVLTAQVSRFRTGRQLAIHRVIALPPQRLRQLHPVQPSSRPDASILHGSELKAGRVTQVKTTSSNSARNHILRVKTAASKAT